jgi:hypothetical protein
MPWRARLESLFPLPRLPHHFSLCGSWGGKGMKAVYVVYNSRGQFQARFLTWRAALRWAIREGMEWTAVIRKEREEESI